MIASASLKVELGARSYVVHLGSGLLESAGALLAPLLAEARAFVVTDRQVATAGHLERLEDSLRRHGVTVVAATIPPGEASKSFAQLDALCQRLLDAGVERRSTILALGGGVVGDLAGFAAAILLRGIAYVQIPTTLLAQVDSAVGGKTGIDTPQGKNLVGAFHQPRAVVIDLRTLTTLPKRELSSGFAEVVKYGAIRDGAFFAWLEDKAEDLLAGDEGARLVAIRRSLAIKAEIVAADEKETSGERALLNFGHTFAHALEAATGYGDALRHGEAVAMGMMMAARLSQRLGLATAAEEARLGRLLRRFGLPLWPEERGLRLDPGELLEHMRRDKKVDGGVLRFILWRGIGDAVLVPGVDTDQVRRLLDDVCGSQPR